MSMDSPSPPTPADPNTVAANQQTINTQAGATQQAASNVNQTTPFGSLSYQQTGTGPGGVPLYTATTSLSPQMQGIVNTLQGGTQGLLSNANYGSQSPADAIGGMTSGATKDLLDKETSYLNPFFTQQSSQLDTKLKNQGLDPSQPAYQQAMNNLLQSQNQGVTGFLAQAEPAAYAQASNSYTLPLTMAAQQMGLMNPNMVTGSLATTPQNQTQPANLIGATANYNTAQEAAYQDQLKQNTAMMSGLFGIPTSILGGWAGSPAGGAAITSAMGAI